MLFFPLSVGYKGRMPKKATSLAVVDIPSSRPELHYIALRDITPYVRNPRKNAGSVPAVKASLKEFGWQQPLVLDADHTIIIGDTRYRAACELADEAGDTEGNTVVPCFVASNLSPERVKALRIVDNKTHELATWDMELLQLELQELSLDLPPLQLSFAGGLTELQQLVAAPPGSLTGDTSAGDTGERALKEAEPRFDKGEALQKEWGVETGQLWQLGEHRLLCGDSTKQEDVARLVQHRQASLCVTSPPYSTQRLYMQDTFPDWTDLMKGVCGTLPLVLASDGQLFVNLGLVHRDAEWVPYWDPWIMWMSTQGWRRFGWYVWDQGSGLPGDWAGRLAPSHEFIFHFNRMARKPQKTKDCIRAGKQSSATGLRNPDGSLSGWSGDGIVAEKKIPDSVIRAHRHTARGVVDAHPAPFSLAFAAELIAPYSLPGEIVYEPFSGSGTTILACEQLRRMCYAMEIAPQYVAISLQRFFDATDVRPVLL